jgi:hypothetical protein
VRLIPIARFDQQGNRELGCLRTHFVARVNFRQIEAPSGAIVRFFHAHILDQRRLNESLGADAGAARGPESGPGSVGAEVRLSQLGGPGAGLLNVGTGCVVNNTIFAGNAGCAASPFKV